MRKQTSYIPLLSFFYIFALVSCSPSLKKYQDERFKKRVSEMMEEHPEILSEFIKSHPLQVVQAFESAVELAQNEQEARRLKEERLMRERAMQVHYNPEIRSDELIRGTPGAPLVLVMYFDFECHSCARGADTVQLLLQEYPGQIQVIYKHLPQQMHANAMISAKYYEALRLQNEKFAVAFHDELFERQHELRRGESFLKQMARGIGADLRRLAIDLESEAILDRIEQDRMEAREFGLRGTPSFLLNGIPITGAYPPERFHELISALENQ